MKFADAMNPRHAEQPLDGAIHRIGRGKKKPRGLPSDEVQSESGMGSMLLHNRGSTDTCSRAALPGPRGQRDEVTRAEGGDGGVKRLFETGTLGWRGAEHNEPRIKREFNHCSPS
jgi:hypothetical protein